MSSDSESIESSDSIESMDCGISDSSEEEWGVITGVIAPYQDEPLADENDEETGVSSEETDVDGLTPSTLEARYERTVDIDSWCRCEQCNTGTLVGSLEFRCCREVTNSSAKMVFDGSIERIKCITQHEDYDAITNRAVLLQVAPLLRNQDGGTYRPEVECQKTSSLELLHTDGPQGGFVATWAGITEDHYQPVFTIISELNTSHKIPEVLLLLMTESSIVHIIKTMT